MTVPKSGKPVKNGTTADVSNQTDPGVNQKPLFKSQKPSLPKANRADKPGGRKKSAEGGTNQQRDHPPTKPAGKPRRGGTAKARRQREPPPANPPAAEEDTGPFSITKGKAGPPPDFVGSKHQRTRKNKTQGFFVGAWAAMVSRTKAELLVLSQLAYWFGVSKRTGKLRAKRILNDRHWVYKLHGKFAVEIGLTKDQTRGALRSLVRRGLVILLDTRKPGEAPHYRLDPEAIDREIEMSEKKLRTRPRAATGTSFPRTAQPRRHFRGPS